MKKNRFILYAIALLQGMVFYAPVATLYRQAQGVSFFEISVIESVSLALCILLEVPWGIVADRIGYRRTMVFCSFLYFVSKIVFWRAAGFGAFLAERVLLGVVVAGISGVDTSILYLSSEGEDCRKVFGIYNSMSMAGLLLAAAVFSALVRDDYALAGFLTVVSYGLAAALSLALTEVRKSGAESAEEGSMRATFRALVGQRALVLFLVASALLAETHQTVTVFLNQLQYERCGMGSTGIGVVYIAATLLGTLGFCSARATRRLGERRTLLLFCCLAALPCLLLACVQRALPSVAAILALRLSHTLFAPFQTELLNRQITVRNRATALSACAMLTDGVAVGTNLAFGALSERSLPAAFCFGGIICALSLLLFAVWRKRTCP